MICICFAYDWGKDAQRAKSTRSRAMWQAQSPVIAAHLQLVKKSINCKKEVQQSDGFLRPKVFWESVSRRWRSSPLHLWVIFAAFPRPPKEGSYRGIYLGWPTCVLASGIWALDLSIIRDAKPSVDPIRSRSTNNCNCHNCFNLQPMQIAAKIRSW